MNLLESKKLNTYKRLLSVFSEFVDKNPGTGLSNVYAKILSCGVKCLPKDKRAMEILNSVIFNKTVSQTVQELMNTALTDLPVTVRPVYKKGNFKLTAFYNKAGKNLNKVMDLLHLDKETGGVWADEGGEQVDLIELDKEA